MLLPAATPQWFLMAIALTPFSNSADIVSASSIDTDGLFSTTTGSPTTIFASSMACAKPASDIVTAIV
jgi:hypothetical protein